MTTAMSRSSGDVVIRRGHSAPVHRGLAFTFVLAGCAMAGKTSEAPPLDAAGGDSSNARGSDASGCTPTTGDLLMNGAFDTTPIGSGWDATPANPMYPIITANGLAPQSAPDKAWMGSVVSKNDEMYEDVAIPASATSLVLAGYYQVKTYETASSVHDTALVEIADTTGTQLESALTLDNTAAGATWVAFTHPLTSPVAGQTIRIRFTTQNDSANATSFYFDTVSLTASYCH